MKTLALTAVFVCLPCAGAAALPTAAPVASTGPTGVASLSAFVGQWTCVLPGATNASTWTIAYDDNGQALHLAIAAPSAAGAVAHVDVYIVAHAPANDLYAFGVGAQGWDFGRSVAFDGKTVSFASLQSSNGTPFTHTLQLLSPQTFYAKTDTVLPSGAPTSVTLTCTKA
jgi:hypothetical protein